MNRLNQFIVNCMHIRLTIISKCCVVSAVILWKNLFFASEGVAQKEGTV